MPASAELHDRRKKPHSKKAPSLVEGQLGAALSAAGVAGVASNNRGMMILQRFLDGLHAIFSEVLPHRASEMIIKEACRILECERATLFYVDGDELVLMIAKGAKNIRLPKSKGIAGYVASTGHTVKIDDAYAEARFDPSFDKQSGFRTRNILATQQQQRQQRRQRSRQRKRACSSCIHAKRRSSHRGIGVSLRCVSSQRSDVRGVAAQRKQDRFAD
jgi:hypothetical protein